MDDKDKITNYSQFLKGEQKDKFQSRLEELIKTANKFIDEAGYSEYVRCDERIMMNALLKQIKVVLNGYTLLIVMETIEKNIIQII